MLTPFSGIWAGETNRENFKVQIYYIHRLRSLVSASVSKSTVLEFDTGVELDVFNAVIVFFFTKVLNIQSFSSQVRETDLKGTKLLFIDLYIQFIVHTRQCDMSPRDVLEALSYTKRCVFGTRPTPPPFPLYLPRPSKSIHIKRIEIKLYIHYRFST